MGLELGLVLALPEVAGVLVVEPVEPVEPVSVEPAAPEVEALPEAPAEEASVDLVVEEPWVVVAKVVEAEVEPWVEVVADSVEVERTATLPPFLMLSALPD